MLPQLLFVLYAKRKALRVLYNSDALIGIAIDGILPDIKLAAEMESERRTLTKEQLVKRHCLMADPHIPAGAKLY